MKTTKRLFSLFLLLAMVASLFSGVAYASDEFDAPDVMEPVTEEVTEDPVPEEVTEEEAPLTSGDEALVPVEEEALAVEEAPVSDALPEEAEEATEEEAPAEDGAVTVVTTADKLKTAVDNGGEIQLGADIELDAKLEVPYTCTIDLNGYELYQGKPETKGTKSTTSWVIAIEVINKANLTVTDSSEGKTGKIWARNDGNSNMAGIYNSSDGIVTVDGGTVAGSTLPPDEDEALDNLNCTGFAYGIYNAGIGTVVVNGGTVKGKAAKYTSYGIYSNSKGIVKVNGGTISARSNDTVAYAVYIKSDSECTIAGGSFTCSGGSTGSDHDVYVNGATLNIDKYTGAKKLSIWVQGEKAKVTGDMTKVDKATSVVNGGVFSDAGVADLVSVGYEVVTNEDVNFPYKVQRVAYTLVLQGGNVYKSENLGSTLESQTVTGITCSGSAQDGYTYTFTNLDFDTAATTALMVKDTAATVTLVGDSTIKGGNQKPSSKAIRIGLQLAESLTINGSGTLTVTSAAANSSYASRGIYFNASDAALTIDGGAAVVADGTALTSGTCVAYGIAGENKIALTVNDGSLTATGVTQAIYGTTTVNGKVTAGADAASAADVTSVGTEKYVHIEPKPMAASVTIDSTTTKYETLADAWAAAQTAGTATVKLLANVTGNVMVESEDVITLDLNGYVLQGDGTDSVITNEGTLTIKDSNPNAEHKFDTTTSPWVWNETDGGTVVKGGCITGGNARLGGGVYNKSTTSTFNMTGGSIIGNTATRSSGGVYNLGTFNMNGANITGNTSVRNAGGVGNNGTFNMTSGSITGNTATLYSGGVANAGNATFKMTGGSITGNTAEQYYGGGVSNGGTFTMEGGSITGNTAATDAGGVYNVNTLYLGGTAQITGNTAGENKNNNNIHVISGTITLGTGTETKSTIASEEDVLKPAAGMCIGVTMNGGTGKFTSNGSEEHLKYFFSDNTSYAVKYNDSKYLEIASYTPSTTESFSASLTLTNSLAINIYIKNADGGNYSMVANGDRETFVTSGEYLKASLKNLNATDIGKTIHFVVYKGTDILGQFDYSIKTYCENKINDDDVGALCKAILDYGAAAQVYCGQTNTTRDSYATELEDVTIPESTASSDNLVATAQVSATDKVDVKIRVKNTTDTNADRYLLTYTDGGTNYYLNSTVTQDGEDVLVTVPGLQPTHFNWKFTLYYNSTGYNKYTVTLSQLTGDAYVTTSVNDYLKLACAGENTAQQNLCKALYQYGKEAVEYAESIGN